MAFTSWDLTFLAQSSVQPQDRPSFDLAGINDPFQRVRMRQIARIQQANSQNHENTYMIRNESEESDSSEESSLDSGFVDSSFKIALQRSSSIFKV